MKIFLIEVTVFDKATKQDYENILSDTKSDKFVFKAKIIQKRCKHG